MKNKPKFERGDIATLIGDGYVSKIGDLAVVTGNSARFGSEHYMEVIWLSDTEQRDGTYYADSFILKHRGKPVMEREINPDRAHRIIKRVKDGGPRWGNRGFGIRLSKGAYWHKIVSRKKDKKVYYLLYEKGIFLKAFKRHYPNISLDGNRKQVPTYVQLPVEFGRILDMSLFPWRPEC